VVPVPGGSPPRADAPRGTSASGSFSLGESPPLGAISFGHAYVAHGWFLSDDHPEAAGTPPTPLSLPAGVQVRHHQPVSARSTGRS
jgi:hypothetical protein